MVKSQTDPNASTVALVAIAAFSAAAFDLNLSKCRKSLSVGRCGKRL
jgi:hypothetical protein